MLLGIHRPYRSIHLMNFLIALLLIVVFTFGASAEDKPEIIVTIAGGNIKAVDANANSPVFCFLLARKQF